MTTPAPSPACPQQAPPVESRVEKKRSRRIYVLWGIALTLLVSTAVLCWAVVVPVWQASAVPRPRFEVGDRHYVRSDDFGEYQGLHLYTLARDGRLYHTDYPSKMKGIPSRHRLVGSWQERDGKLTWKFADKSICTTYAVNKKGTYVEERGSYYVPVTLMPVAIRDGRPTVEQGGQEFAE